MHSDPPDRATAALHRLLQEAVQGGQAKVDALLALMQRTVFVAPWPVGIEGFRTLVNSQGVAALPIFTDRAQLETAARRYGWVAPDGSVPAVEIGARGAFTHAKSKNLAYVVVDIAAAHCLEIPRSEYEPLLTPAARRESTGPFSGMGKISSSLLAAVKTGTPQPPLEQQAHVRALTPPPGSLAVPPRSGASGSSPGAFAAPRPPAASGPAEGTPPAGPAAPMPSSSIAERGRKPSTQGLAALEPAPAVPGTVIPGGRLGAPTPPPSDELLQRLDAVLRAYPEIEWGALGTATPWGLVLGLRIDPRVRQRVDEIAGRVAMAVAPQALPVMVLDDPQHMRTARSEGFVFYPWRRAR